MMMRLRSRFSAALALGAGLAAATVLLPRAAEAVGVDIGNGETLEIAPLAGYCVLDESRPAEAQLILAMRGAVSETMRIALAFGDCNELVDLRNGDRAVLDHFGQVLLLTQGAQIERVTDSRPSYLNAVAKPFPTATIEEVAANGEAQAKASKPSDAPKPVFAVIARDELAIYVGTTSLQGRGTEKTMVAGVAGVGLVRQIPVNINLFSAYDGSAATGKSVFETLIGQMSEGMADLQFTNDDSAMPAALPVPNRSEWQAMGSTALVGAVIGGLLGGVGAIVVVLLRRRRRAVDDPVVGSEVDTASGTAPDTTSAPVAAATPDVPAETSPEASLHATGATAPAPNAENTQGA
ncbi:hypothetical protein [Zavarzinia aquatilis]|uniref:hypothetical protein n=1 Tax=Zavarzinia aquatilis TaxID=2211142 RepID=UPI001057B798|nr:hypothetical protein [Zavarzinia aquatilis]